MGLLAIPGAPIRSTEPCDRLLEGGQPTRMRQRWHKEGCEVVDLLASIEFVQRNRGQGVAAGSSSAHQRHRMIIWIAVHQCQLDFARQLLPIKLADECGPVGVKRCMVSGGQVRGIGQLQPREAIHTQDAEHRFDKA